MLSLVASVGGEPQRVDLAGEEFRARAQDVACQLLAEVRRHRKVLEFACRPVAAHEVRGCDAFRLSPWRTDGDSHLLSSCLCERLDERRPPRWTVGSAADAVVI